MPVISPSSPKPSKAPAERGVVRHVDSGGDTVSVVPYHSLRPGDILESPDHGRAVVLSKVRWNSDPREAGWVLDLQVILPGPKSALLRLPEDRRAYPVVMTVDRIEDAHQVDPNGHFDPSTLPTAYYPPVPAAFLGGDTISYGDGIGWTRDDAGAWTIPLANGAGPVVDDVHAFGRFTGNESLRQLGAPVFLPALPTLDTLPPLTAWSPLGHPWYYAARTGGDGALTAAGCRVRSEAEVSSTLYRSDPAAILDAGGGRIALRGEYGPGQVTVLTPAK